MATFSEFKQKVISCPDLLEIFNCFLDLTDEGKIMEVSKSISPVELKNNAELLALSKMIGDMLSSHLEKKTSVADVMLSAIPSEYFYHGIAKASDVSMPLSLIYFSDIKIGVFVMTNMTGETNTFRFSLAKAEDGIKLH